MPVEKSIGAERPQIMLVEDDPAVRRSLQMLLQSRGFDVRAHASGTTLLADQTLSRAKCLISDYRLGDGDGLQLLRTLRKRGWLGPAILITGFNSPEVELAAVVVGYDSIIDKPLREGHLAALVTRLIETPYNS